MNVRTRLNFEKEKKPDLDPYVAIDVDEVPLPLQKNHFLSVLTNSFGIFTETRKSFIMPNPLDPQYFGYLDPQYFGYLDQRIRKKLFALEKRILALN